MAKNKLLLEDFPSGPRPPTTDELLAWYARSKEICATCSGWKPLQNDPTLGHCVPSMKSMPSAMITMDRWSCGKWVTKA